MTACALSVVRVSANRTVCSRASACARISSVSLRAVYSQTISQSSPAGRELSGGVKLYRLNRGDIQSLREICSKERTVCHSPSRTARLHLGANIGFTSVWLTKQYGFTRVIAVEPDKSNAALVRKNFEPE